MTDQQLFCAIVAIPSLSVAFVFLVYAFVEAVGKAWAR